MKSLSRLALRTSLVVSMFGASACGSLSYTEDSYITAADLEEVEDAQAVAVVWDRTVVVSHEDGDVDLDRVWLDYEGELISVGELADATTKVDVRAASRISLKPPRGSISAGDGALEQALDASKQCTWECTQSGTDNTSLSSSGQTCVEVCPAPTNQMQRLAGSLSRTPSTEENSQLQSMY